jgi:hypothetical protein
VPYTISLLDGGRRATIRWDGSISAAEIRASSVEIIEQAKRAGFTKVVVDVSGITNRLSLAELYFSTEEQAKLGPPRPRAAILGRQDQEQELRFIENMGATRGMPIRAFTSEVEALKWLGE